MLWVPSPSDPGGQRITPWQAPTWSWASQAGEVRYTNAHVRFLGPILMCMSGQDGLLENPGNVESPLWGLSCELLEAVCTPCGADKMGRLASGHAKVRGYVLKLTTLPSCLEAGKENTLVIADKSGGINWHEAPRGFSEQERRAYLAQKFCVLRIGCIRTFKFMGPFTEWSLLLRWVGPEEHVYERAGIVGVFNTVSDTDYDKDTSLWFSSVEETAVVTIV
jgi:hypothetical protein